MEKQSGKLLKNSCLHNTGLFGDIMLRYATFHQQREAFIYGDQRITFQQYNQRVNSLVHALWDMGVRKGDVLGVLSWNCLEYYDVWGAAEKGGFIIAPFNVRLAVNDFEYLINDSGASVVFVGPEFAQAIDSIKPRISGVKGFISFEGPQPGMKCHADLIASYPDVEPEVSVDDDDPVFICYTSGTTGTPRGALYTHRRFRENTICRAMESPMEYGDRGICLMPLFHIGGIALNSTYLYQGATTVVQKSFDAEALLGMIQEHRITDLALVPTHLSAMLDLSEFQDYDVSSIRRICYAGSPMPRELLLRGIKTFGLVFFQAYGQTEAGPEITFLKEKEHDVLDKSAREQRRLISCGRPAIGVHLRIVAENGEDVDAGQVGEIIVKSRHIMQEYWKKPQDTAETIIDGWLHTRDMGTYDEDGYIYMVDRKQDMIVSGGENIYPREVEEVLYKHEAVLECAVFGIPDAKWVEAVHAVVALKKGARATPDELIAYCKANIARYKAPKSLDIVEALPKGGSGKIIKREIRNRYLTRSQEGQHLT